LEDSNLNRYSLFGRSSVGLPKASEAARIAADAGLRWLPTDGPFESLTSFPSRIVSAVDTNRARAAIQNRHPARILSGSTLDLRGEVLRCGPPGEGACLRCYNPPESVASDEQLLEQLRMASETELRQVAEGAGITLDAGKEWIRSGDCGMAGARLLPYLRQSDQTGGSQPQRFAVSFVSVMTGTLLAAETVKDVLGADVPLTDTSSRLVFQFWTPTARTNRAAPYPRDPACPMCIPGTPAVTISKRRFLDLLPQRRGR
jgi:hypothetical protein